MPFESQHLPARVLSRKSPQLHIATFGLGGTGAVRVVVFDMESFKLTPEPWCRPNRWLFIALLLHILSLAELSAKPFETLYVSPDGVEIGGGTAEVPLGSLAHALKWARDDASVIEIVLADGVYELPEPITVQGLDRRGGAALVVRSADGARPIISGGRALRDGWHAAEADDPIVGRMPAEARKNVQVVNLKKEDIRDFGAHRMQGFAERETAPGELFLGFERAPVAGWPNAGESGADPASGIEYGHWAFGELSEGTVPLPPDKAERWSGVDDLWAHGYWGTDWADFHLPVSVVDGGLLPGEEPHFDFKEDGAIRVYNLPEELDQPGEWFLDSESARLYLWPRPDADGVSVFYSRLEQPLLRLEESHNIAFEGITFAHGRGGLVRLDDTSQITFRECRFHASGLEGIHVGGVRNKIANCHFQYLGESAIVLGGGDQQTLSRARNLAVNNRISHYGERYYSYSAGARISGVGNTFRGNLVAYAPHLAVQLNGNLHLVHRNEIHDVCQYSDDAGAIYSGRDWAGWGNRIIENFIHDIRTHRGDRGWVHGVYLDDCASGFIVRRNVFLRIDAFGTNLGGGRSNRIENNFFAHCGEGAHLNDNRGTKWIEAVPGSSWNPFEALRDVPYREEPWLSQFPELAEMPLEFEAAKPYFLPIGTTFTGNAGSDNKQWADFVDWTGAGVEEHYAAYDAIPLKVIDGNRPADWRPGDPKKDFKLEDGTVIPFSKMGRRKE